MKVCSNSSCHMTKMAASPIYIIKTPLKIFFSRTRKLMTLGFDMYHSGCEAYQVCSNDDSMFILSYLTSISNLLLMNVNGTFFEKFFLKLLKPKSLF